MVSMPADAAPGRLWTAEAIHSRPVVMRRATVLSALARRLVALQPRRRLRVAIDGVDGAGKSVLADELATRLMAAGRPAVRASVDSFHRPQADRYRLGRTSPEGFYRDSYDYQRLTEFVLVPFAPGGSGRFRVAGFDHKTDTPVSPPKQHAARRAVLILDGIFLHRPELRASWDFSISARRVRRIHCPLRPAGWFGPRPGRGQQPALCGRTTPLPTRGPALAARKCDHRQHQPDGARHHRSRRRQKDCDPTADAKGQPTG
jgi:uridine kinase